MIGLKIAFTGLLLMIAGTCFAYASKEEGVSSPWVVVPIVGIFFAGVAAIFGGLLMMIWL